ncbi:hypothetical protein KC573_01150 [candidate division WWE3 bacterium]|uniref:ATP-grasp domain-containing protein n=1 Tax=candidate division WWE3 bacterium TaxID=2053526 RepID=A0A955RWU1_UNCKA|nr:hypothetical protein [candidate division WWE3 bacterium]
MRTLKQNGISFVIIAKDNKDQILKTEYKHNVIVIREEPDLDLKYIRKYFTIITHKLRSKKYLIAPTTEALNRFLQKEREVLSQLGIIVPLCNSDIYNKISDKKTFSDTCRKYGICTPREYVSINDAYFPFVAKPKTYFAHDGTTPTPILIFNEQHKQEFLNSYSEGDFYFQEYIDGRCVYLLYYFHRNGDIYKLSQENFVQQANGKSMIAAVTTNTHTSEVAVNFENLFVALGFYGLVMVEIKLSNNNSYMIEANPRFWGPSQLFVDAGKNLFEAFLHDYKLIESVPPFNKDTHLTRYFWFGGVCNSFRNSGKIIFHNLEEEKFLLDMHLWINAEIFKRADTIEIFKEELKCHQLID